MIRLEDDPYYDLFRNALRGGAIGPTERFPGLWGKLSLLVVLLFVGLGPVFKYLGALEIWFYGYLVLWVTVVIMLISLSWHSVDIDEEGFQFVSIRGKGPMVRWDELHRFQRTWRGVFSNPDGVRIWLTVIWFKRSGFWILLRDWLNSVADKNSDSFPVNWKSRIQVPIVLRENTEYRQLITRNWTYRYWIERNIFVPLVVIFGVFQLLSLKSGTVFIFIVYLVPFHWDAYRLNRKLINSKELQLRIQAGRLSLVVSGHQIERNLQDLEVIPIRSSGVLTSNTIPFQMGWVFYVPEYGQLYLDPRFFEVV